MKSKNEKPEPQDELNRCRYSVLQNVRYCLKNTAQCHFPLLGWCAILIGIKVTLPVLSTFMPKTVIQIIMTQKSLSQLVLTILIYMGVIALLSGGNKFFTKYIFHQKYRMNTFYLKKVALKGLTTDYIHQETGVFRKLQTESLDCCSGNYSPLSNIYDVLIELSTNLVGLLIFGILLVKLNGGILLFLTAGALVSYFLNQRILRWIAQNNAERIGYQQRIRYINSSAGDLRSAKDIRLYRMGEWFSDLYHSHMKGLAGWYKRLTGKLFGVAVCDSGLALVRESIVYLYLLYLVWNQRISVADFVLYMSVVTGFSAWLGAAFLQITSLSRMSLKINYFRSYLEYPESFCREGGLPGPAEGGPKTIELKDVSYRYEGADHYALRHINLQIVPGEHLAIVGLNGAGKTTLVKLICGLVDPTEGQVLYDGVDIRKYNRAELYRQFAAVFQQFSLMPVTIEEIVAETPAEHIDSAKVQQCLITAGLWDTIQALPEGVKSQFGKTIYDDGVEFSGGEIQKLLLARALYKGAPVLLLDEPTAALDPIAESRLYENYNQISAGKTTVFISHRLASTSFCERVILIEDGAICEEGSHRELLAQNGKYHHLFEVQAKYYRDKTGDGEVEA